jgi:hypothetical protein
MSNVQWDHKFNTFIKVTTRDRRLIKNQNKECSMCGMNKTPSQAMETCPNFAHVLSHNPQPHHETRHLEYI